VNVNNDLKTLSTAEQTNEINIVAAAATAFGGFLRSGEFTYEARELRNITTFQNTRLLRSDVTFSENNDHVSIRLKRSKTDTGHKGVEIIIAASNSSTCAVRALQRLFRLDPQPPTAPLFRFTNQTFSYSNFVTAIQTRLRQHGFPHWNAFSGHSFRRGAALTAKLNRMLDSDIQRLGRWTSEAFQRYIDTDLSYRYRLNKQFVSGVSPAFST
jgi:hypothetical protein